MGAAVGRTATLSKRCEEYAPAALTAAEVRTAVSGDDGIPEDWGGRGSDLYEGAEAAGLRAGRAGALACASRAGVEDCGARVWSRLCRKIAAGTPSSELGRAFVSVKPPCGPVEGA